MKKAFALLLSAAMLLSTLIGCTNDAATVPGQDDTGAQSGSDVQPAPSGNEGKPINDFYTYALTSSEMESFNVLYTQHQNELKPLTNCVEGLLSNDSHGNLIAGIAETWNTDDGGQTWTFNLREGVTWVDVNGNYKADCVASDWLYGLEWVLNFWKNSSFNSSMPIEMIVGANDYYIYTKGYSSDSEQAVKDDFDAVCDKYSLSKTPLTEAEAKALDLTIFLQMVGIEAPDDHTLIYNLNTTYPYFATIATYNCLYPVSGAMIEELGGADGYLACTNQNMWYNGCYTMTTYVQNNEKVLTKNPAYWDESCSRFDTVTIKMVESLDVAYQLYQSGELDHVELSESNLQTIYKSESHEYHDELVESRPTKYSYQLRLVFDKKLESGEPDTNWNTAVANEPFRLAWYYGLDFTPFLERNNTINPLKCANYTYSASNLCVTSDGTDYVNLVLDRLGIPQNSDRVERVDAGQFAQYKQQAIQELTEKGVTFPVEVDYYIIGSSQTELDNATVLKQIFSDCLGDDFAVLNIKTYVTSVAQEVRNPQLASIYVGAWGADYGDPYNFLAQEMYGYDNAIMATQVTKSNYATDPDLIAEFQEFTKMVEDANAITSDLDARYNAFADAEAYLLEHVLVLPLYVQVRWQLTHVNDYSKIYANYGIHSDIYKNWATSTQAYTTAEYAEFEAAYNNGN